LDEIILGVFSEPIRIKGVLDMLQGECEGEDINSWPGKDQIE
jgi:hypothetical protein